MGVPIMEPAASRTDAELAVVRAEASLHAADASLRSLSSLLLAARGAVAANGAAPHGNTDWSLVAAPVRLHGPLPTLRPGTVRPRFLPAFELPQLPSVDSPLFEAGMSESSLPPLLASASASSSSESESESEESEESDGDGGVGGEAVPLPSASQASDSAVEDPPCPWGTAELNDELMQDVVPRRHTAIATVVRDGSAFRSNYFSGSRARSEGLWAAPGGRAPRRNALAAAGRGRGAAEGLSLEADLAAMAGQVADLVRTHQRQLSSTDPHIRAGLQDVANQLYRLSNMLHVGPPAPS